MSIGKMIGEMIEKAKAMATSAPAADVPPAHIEYDRTGRSRIESVPKSEGEKQDEYVRGSSKTGNGAIDSTIGRMSKRRQMYDDLNDEIGKSLR
jgi:hypothetical protein